VRIVEDTLSVQLKADGEVVIGAKLYAEVAAKTWIWKGVNLGPLGCLKMSSCGGSIVTYSANIDTRVTFTVKWSDKRKKMDVKVKPLQTQLYDVKVLGCKPPWYLSWFKQWKDVLNSEVRKAVMVRIIILIN